MEPLTSTSNPRIKAILALRRRGAAADAGHILIDGTREIARAIDAGLTVTEMYFCPELFVEDAGELLRLAQARDARCIPVARHVFEKIRYGDRTGGLLVVARRPRRTMDELRLSECPLIAVVEHVGKPGNLGAILRSADGAGVEAVWCADSAIDVYGPNVIRASTATLFTLPLVETTTAEAAAYLAARGIQIIAAAPDGSTVYTALDYRRPTAFVFGAEDRGLSEDWQGAGVVTARVPMRGRADSLNVATTAALFFYEALRQRTTVS